MANDITHQICTACNERKEIRFFGACKGYATGFRTQCTPCRGNKNKALNAHDEARAKRRAYSREYYKNNPEKARARKPRPADVRRRALLRDKFRITPEKYDQLLASQGGGCAICGRAPTDSQSKAFPVDHCHKDGRVRGILCTQCNQGLGLLADDVPRLQAAIRYLTEAYTKPPIGRGKIT